MFYFLIFRGAKV